MAEVLDLEMAEDLDWYQVTVSNEDEVVLIDHIDESLIDALERHYESLGYFVVKEKM